GIPGRRALGFGRLVQQLVHGRFARRLLASVRRRPAQLRPRRRLLTLRAEHRPAVKRVLPKCLRQRCIQRPRSLGLGEAPLLTSATLPNAQPQPYLRVGPAIFVAHADDSFNFAPGNQTDSDTSVGVKLGTGVSWLFTRNIGVFGEYRYTHFSPEFTFR